MDKNINKCSTSLAIKEMQIQTMLRVHLTPVKMASTPESTGNSKTSTS
jgi:hypothetical protein